MAENLKIIYVHIPPSVVLCYLEQNIKWYLLDIGLLSGGATHGADVLTPLGAFIRAKVSCLALHYPRFLKRKFFDPSFFYTIIYWRY